MNDVSLVWNVSTVSLCQDERYHVLGVFLFVGPGRFDNYIFDNKEILACGLTSGVGRKFNDILYHLKAVLEEKLIV